MLARTWLAVALALGGAGCASFELQARDHRVCRPNPDFCWVLDTNRGIGLEARWAW